MNKYIQKLQEAKTLNEAKNILGQLGANGSIRKNVETYFMTRNSADANAREWGMSCMNEAVTTLKDSEQPAIPESPGLTPKGKHFVQEEELSNHNADSRGAGSDQSTSNTGLPMEGTQTDDEDMQNAPDTENQMTELEDENPATANVLENTGLDPTIAKKMGANMPEIPPMSSGDQVKQMKYTMRKYHETVVLPLIKHSKAQDAAIKKLSSQVRETKSMSLHMPDKDNSTMSFRETTGPTGNDYSNNQNDLNKVVPNKSFELIEKRNSITQYNDSLAAQMR